VSDAENPGLPNATPAPEPAPDPVPKRKRRWLRRISVTSAILLVVLVCSAVALYYWASSASFEEAIRQRAIAEIENATGGRVEVGAFRWDLLHLRAEFDGLTIHGLEAATEAPYAHVEKLRFQVAILGLFTSGVSTHIILREAEIVEPQFHLIVYPDGTTNQPHPHHPVTPNKPVMDTLFDAQIGKLWIEHGTAQIANHSFPLDLEARDANLLLSWLPGTGAAGNESETKLGSYRIVLNVGELAFAEGKQHPLPSRVDATLLLGHEGVDLQELRLQVMDRTLNLSGKLNGWRDPAWQAEMHGQIDMRILAPYAGFPLVRSGIVSLNATVTGKGADFNASGNLSSGAIHYQDPIVDARLRSLSAQFQADTRLLLVSRIRGELAEGGEVLGEFQYDNWLKTTPRPAEQRALLREHKSWLKPKGTIRAKLNRISLDTILDMLAAPKYRRLGLDAIFSGPATATWTGLANDLAIGGQLGIVPSANPVAGEAPANGAVDATFHSELGSVIVRTLDLQLPHSKISGNGSLGVVPVNRASEMSLDLASSDLSEFDGVLQALDLKNGDRTGSAALPVNLKGEAQFHGQLHSSWLTPRIDGHLSATNIDLEIPIPAEEGAPSTIHELHWDSIDLDGLYSPGSIVVRHGALKRGSSSLTLQGQLDSADPAYELDEDTPDFDENALLNLKTSGHDIAIGDLLLMAGVDAKTVPIAGTLNAEVNVQGKLNDLSGSGSLDVSNATLYGEQIEHVQANATVHGHEVKIAHLTATQSASGGRLTGSGSYDLKQQTFQIDTHASAIDLASIHAVANTGIAIIGKLGLTATGSGSLDKPHFETHATFSDLTLAGEPVSDLNVTASANNGEVTYDLDSRQAAGEFKTHGTTKFNADYTTEATLQFAKFNVGAVLKLLKVTGITGRSDLEGTATVSGPAAHPEKMRGEAQLKEFAVDVEGVHLASKGAVHASLADGIARLDPVEITGEDTDIKLGGTLAVTGNKQLDLKANGSVNLRLAESLDPDLVASGSTKFQMEAHGPVSDPQLQGQVEFVNASLALGDFPNGLSQIKGTLEFMQNRLQVRTLTAMSGGGQLSVSGYVGFQRGLYADLTATGKGIRIRYPQGISSLADAKIRLQGPQNNLLLSGTVEVNRFTINSDLDLASLVSANGGVQPIASPDAPSNHIRLDVHLTSAPQLNFQNAFAKLAGDVDLHIRGTLASPSMLGRISLTEGSTSVGGTKYELQRGDIVFSNPVRIQPNIDLEATARVEDYDITLGLHGTTDKLNVSYRSEPPLPEADVIALLALGRTQSEQAAYTQQQQQAGDNPMTDALLGGALNATVSNRVQRLFGTGAVKIDPNFIGSLGNSSARVTVVEQIGKNITFTYASNVNTTTQQLIQAEIAVNRHVSLVVTQDESGIFSVVVKARRRFK
jgi:translocation and assembly module TamB